MIVGASPETDYHILQLSEGMYPVSYTHLECRRENDGGFTLHLTLHQPTQQPLDTLYTLRLDPGRQTVVTLIFIREAFGYKAVSYTHLPV